MLTWWQGATAGEYGGGVGVIAGLVLPRDRDGQGRKRISGGHPRVPRHAAGGRADHRVPARPLDTGPLGGPRGRALIDRDARNRHQDGPRAVRVALARPHPAQGVHSHFNPRTSSPVRLHASQLRRARRRRQRAHLGAQHVQPFYKVDRKTGHILWCLGGKRSSFRLPKYARFVGQHDFTRAEGRGRTRCSTTRTFSRRRSGRAAPRRARTRDAAGSPGSRACRRSPFPTPPRASWSSAHHLAGSSPSGAGR